MGVEDRLLDAALKLVEAAHQQLDKAMPAKLAGIVKTHAALSVGASWIPIPGVDIAGCAGAVWSMYYRINRELKMPFSENIVKSIASGVGSNLLAYVGVGTVAGALKLVPGVGTLAGAVILSAASYAATLGSGYVYMKVLTLLLKQKPAGEITEFDLKGAADKVLGQKELIKSFLKEAQRAVKKQAPREEPAAD